MSDLMSAGGSFSVMVLGLAGIGLLAALALAGVAFAKRRVPLTLLVFFPIATCAIGAVGAWSSAGSTLSAIGGTDAGSIVEFATTGLQDAIAADWFSRWVAAFLFGVGTWAAAVGAFFAGPEARMTPVAAVSAAVTTVVAAITIAVYSALYGIGGGTLLVALILFCGLGVAFSALKRALYEHAHRVAGMRFAASMCMLLAVSYGGRALTMGNRIDTFGPDGIATQADSLVAAIGMWTDIAAPVASLAWLGFAFALLIAFAGFYYELGEVVERFTLVDVFLTLFLVAGLGAVRVLADSSVDTVASISTNAPAAAVYGDAGGDLAAALLSIDKNVVGVRPANGGFGDVLHRKDEQWTRVSKWHGAGWSDDDTPLESVQQFSSLRPLLVISGGDEAQDLPAIVEKIGGEALLLLRAEEVKNEVVVPPELAYLQVTYLPIILSDTRDLTTELWAAAGSKKVNWGPTTWYGEGMDEEPISYMAAVYEDSQAPGIHVLTGERSRVKGVASSCLSATMSKTDVEGHAELNDKFCRIGTAEVEDIRLEAMEVWEEPVPEHFRPRFGRVTDLADAGIGGDFIVDRISREFGAVDYCLAQAIDEGEEIDGPMSVVLNFSRKGTVYPNLDERSKNINEVALRCLKDRLKQIEFTVDEEAWPEPTVPEEGEEPEEIEAQVLDLLLDIRV